jgi:hypothetical protein
MPCADVCVTHGNRNGETSPSRRTRHRGRQDRKLTTPDSERTTARSPDTRVFRTALRLPP